MFIITNDIFEQFTSYTLSVAPLFALMGFVAAYSGVGAQMFNAINKFIGHWRGGLAMATQVACAVFGAINGSYPATIGTMCAVAYPEMRRFKYDVTLSTCCNSRRLDAGKSNSAEPDAHHLRLRHRGLDRPAFLAE
jgi:TRAP-type C4-dicarboxylate transport system permease large subunit